MLTKKYGKLFRCDYEGITTIADTRTGARIFMQMAIFGSYISYEELVAR